MGHVALLKDNFTIFQMYFFELLSQRLKNITVRIQRGEDLAAFDGLYQIIIHGLGLKIQPDISL
jgi:hypothetical protein